MYNKIKEHIKRHETVYGCIVTGIGVAGFTTIIMRKYYAGSLGLTAPEGLGSTGGFGKIQTRAFSLAFSQTNCGNAITSIHTGKPGHPGYITRNLETGQVTRTQTAMAKMFDIPRPLLSDHLNGKIPDVDGMHFERVAISG